MDSKLLCKIVQGVEGVAGVKPLLILAVAAFDLPIMAMCVRANEFVPDAQFGSRLFKQRWQVAPAVGETIGKLKAVVRLDALHLYASALIPFCQFAEEVRGGIGRLLRIGGEETQARELVDGGVLEQTKLRICNAGGTTFTST